DEGMMFIAEALADSAITQLDVSNTGIGDRGVITLSFNLPHTKIISLNLANNYISPVSMPYIAESLGNSSVADIDFSGNRIGDVGISSLSSVTFVDPLCPVTRINLGFNQISAEGATAMADAFATGNVTLTSAVLAGNPITDAGLSELAATLAQTHLLKLDLSGCGITAEGALAFADALPTSSIQSVKLDSNQIADAGALELAQKLIAPVSHQSDLGKQKLSQDLSQAIFAAGPDSQLLNLSLVDNGIGNSGAQALCHVFSAANITSFELAANQIDPSQVDILSCNIMPDISPGSRLEPPLTFVFNGIMEQMPKVDPIAARTFYRKNYGEDFSSLLRLFADTLGTTEVKIQLLYCLAGFLLAFRHEAAGLISRCLSKTMQTRLAGYLNTHEGQLLSIMTEMAARAEFGGVPALVHDVTVIAKSPLEQATNGLLTLAGAYGIAFAVGALTGNPLIGYLSLPIFLNGKKIVTNMQESYQKHGFFAAAERGLETFAYSVPGGQLIEQRQTDCLGGNHV
ncbi:MAG: hypothetical protein KAT71_03460, partial [Gammaproteobacteria bacterium]|nr:hypothetical protein [Gammaproteobacteria bacterium]